MGHGDGKGRLIRLGLLSFIPSVWKLTGYFKKQIEICRKNPRPGMMSALVQAEMDGQKLSKDELLASLFLLLVAGHETTVHLLSGGVLSLLSHPMQKKDLMADWSLAYDAVGEILRYNSSVQMTKPRFASRDMELYGQKIQQGDVFMPLLAAANADPAQFPAPEKFDIRRTPNHQIGFGTGIHVCLGQKLAWAEAEIALEKLFTRFPNLEQGAITADLDWIERIGTRGLHKMPLNLKGTLAQTGNHAA